MCCLETHLYAAGISRSWNKPGTRLKPTKRSCRIHSCSNLLDSDERAETCKCHGFRRCLKSITRVDHGPLNVNVLGLSYYL